MNYVKVDEETEDLIKTGLKKAGFSDTFSDLVTVKEQTEPWPFGGRVIYLSGIYYAVEYSSVTALSGEEKYNHDALMLIGIKFAEGLRVQLKQRGIRI